jgi:hypothetical protein
MTNPNWREGRHFERTIEKLFRPRFPTAAWPARQSAAVLAIAALSFLSPTAHAVERLCDCFDRDAASVDVFFTLPGTPDAPSRVLVDLSTSVVQSREELVGVLNELNSLESESQAYAFWRFESIDENDDRRTCDGDKCAALEETNVDAIRRRVVCYRELLGDPTASSECASLGITKNSDRYSPLADATAQLWETGSGDFILLSNGEECTDYSDVDRRTGFCAATPSVPPPHLCLGSLGESRNARCPASWQSPAIAGESQTLERLARGGMSTRFDCQSRASSAANWISVAIWVHPLRFLASLS